MSRWKTKGDPGGRPNLFCPKCDRCMATKEDVRSREERGFCERCSETSVASEFQADVVTIVLNEGA